MYSFSKFCIPHWLSSLQQRRRKVLKETQKNHIKTFIFGKYLQISLQSYHFPLATQPLQEVKTNFPSWRTQADNRNKMACVFPAKFSCHMIWIDQSHIAGDGNRCRSQGLGLRPFRGSRNDLENYEWNSRKYVVFWLRSYGLECITHYFAAMVIVWWIAISIIIFKRPFVIIFSDTGNEVQSG